MNSENRKDSLPLISICATFFNAERYIHRLIESCIHQTYSNWELVLVDDQSADESRAVIKRYEDKDRRIKYFSNPERVGLAESILKMFQLASGQFAMMIGADDWLAADYVENSAKTLNKHPNVAGAIPRLLGIKESNDETFSFVSDTF